MTTTYPQPFLSNSFCPYCWIPAGADMPVLLLLLLFCGPHADHWHSVLRFNVGSPWRVPAPPWGRWRAKTAPLSPNNLKPTTDLKPTVTICHDHDTCYDVLLTWSKCTWLDQKENLGDKTNAKFFQGLARRKNSRLACLRHLGFIDQCLYMLQWMHCLALCVFVDLELCRSKKNLLLSVSWALSAKERNRLAHALNGNTQLRVILW